jgi:1-acyl-sn-glycerol-3-phosphate acyltransferase
VTGTLWQPRSACGPACLPSPVDTGAVAAPVAVLRLLRLAAVLLAAGLAAPVLALARPPVRRRALRRFAGAALRALNVTVAVHGPVRQPRALLVANHVSWLDILVLLSGAPAGSRVPVDLRLVAKAEVRDWPVIGRLAATAGTIFIDRSRPRLLPATVAAVREALARGERVAVFPEGTTSCGRDTGPFRPAMFQAAIEARAAVVPVRLRYRLPGGGATTAAAYVGDETLLRSLRRVLPLPGLRVEIRACSAIHPDPHASRRVLAHLAGAAVGAPVSPVAPPARRAPRPVPYASLSS